jgi:hypothetical protein
MLFMTLPLEKLQTAMPPSFMSQRQRAQRVSPRRTDSLHDSSSNRFDSLYGDWGNNNENSEPAQSGTTLMRRYTAVVDIPVPISTKIELTAEAQQRSLQAMERKDYMRQHGQLAVHGGIVKRQSSTATIAVSSRHASTVDGVDDAPPQVVENMPGYLGHRPIMEPVPGTSRINHTIVNYGGGMYLYGGRQINGTAGQYVTGIFMYAAHRQTWSEIDVKPGASAGKRGDHTAVVVDDCMVVFGGRKHLTVLSDMWLYHFMHNYWEHIEHEEGVGPGPLFGHTACAGTELNRMYLMGGFHSEQHRALVHCWDCRYRYWRRITGPPGVDPNKLHDVACVAHRGAVYVYGLRPEDPCMYALDEKTEIWTEVATMGLPAIPPRVSFLSVQPVFVPASQLWIFFVLAPPASSAPAGTVSTAGLGAARAGSMGGTKRAVSNTALKAAAAAAVPTLSASRVSYFPKLPAAVRQRAVTAFAYHFHTSQWARLELHSTATGASAATNAMLFGKMLTPNTSAFERKLATCAFGPPSDQAVALFGGTNDVDQIFYRVSMNGGPPPSMTHIASHPREGSSSATAFGADSRRRSSVAGRNAFCPSSTEFGTHRALPEDSSASSPGLTTTGPSAPSGSKKRVQRRASSIVSVLSSGDDSAVQTPNDANRRRRSTARRGSERTRSVSMADSEPEEGSARSRRSVFDTSRSAPSSNVTTVMPLECGNSTMPTDAQGCPLIVLPPAAHEAWLQHHYASECRWLAHEKIRDDRAVAAVRRKETIARRQQHSEQQSRTTARYMAATTTTRSKVLLHSAAALAEEAHKPLPPRVRQGRDSPTMGESRVPQPPTPSTREQVIRRAAAMTLGTLLFTLRDVSLSRQQRNDPRFLCWLRWELVRRYVMSGRVRPDEHHRAALEHDAAEQEHATTAASNTPFTRDAVRPPLPPAILQEPPRNVAGTARRVEVTSHAIKIVNAPHVTLPEGPVPKPPVSMRSVLLGEKTDRSRRAMPVTVRSASYDVIVANNPAGRTTPPPSGYVP